MTRLKAVFFDLDDTLCDDASVWIRSAQAAALIALERRVVDDPGPLAEAFLRHSEAYWMSMEPIRETRPLLQIRSEQWASALVDVTGRTDIALATELGREYGLRRSTDIALYPDALETLAVLRANDVALALLTNGVQLTHLEKIEYLGLHTEFDHVLIADAIGSFKPDPYIFEEGLRRCGCKASEAIMVGDHLRNDIGGAQAIGMDGYWFNPSGQLASADDPVPKGEIKALSEIIDVVESRLF